MKELFPIVFFAACLGITAFFATGLVLFLVGSGIFGLITAFAGNLAATLILVAAFFACMIFLFRVFLNWYANELQLVTLMDVIWTLMLTAGFVTGDRVRRKNKAMKDKIENELKKK